MTGAGEVSCAGTTTEGAGEASVRPAAGVRATGALAGAAAGIETALPEGTVVAPLLSMMTVGASGVAAITGATDSAWGADASGVEDDEEAEGEIH
jgi:hypothetical protein